MLRKVREGRATVFERRGVARVESAATEAGEQGCSGEKGHPSGRGVRTFCATLL